MDGFVTNLEKARREENLGWFAEIKTILIGKNILDNEKLDDLIEEIYQVTLKQFEK